MTIYLENWKRLNSRETLRWGTAHFSETVNLRPQFYGERIPSPINGKSTRYFPPREKLKRVAYSWVVISFLILIVFVIVSSIFVLTYDLTKGDDSDKLVLDDYKYGSIVSSLANVVQITIMTKIYNYDTFSPVARMATFRMFIAVCIIRDMVIYQGDINTAYLNATLGIKQYLEEVEGYPCEDKGMIYVIDKALYGLSQSGRE
ncbi:hypothetical protein DD237_007498 [Peronospora effusa]|uniref:Anoctamin transmembrane domain-containing protein n=1 Tax=Peronospora effusa TaxID=542832 RepID=A0A425CPC6_9STRA|nr:hypothetical protein DD237_007498 [Peronospora effusa]